MNERIGRIACWTAIILASAAIAVMLTPTLGQWAENRRNPPLHYGTVTAKGLDHGDAGGIFHAFLQPGRFADGKTHYLVEITRGEVRNWWEVSERQYWEIHIGDTLCRMNVREE